MSRRRLTKADLSPHDLAEVEKFEVFLKRVREKLDAGVERHEAQTQAHEEIYGEQIYPPTTQGPTHAGEQSEPGTTDSAEGSKKAFPSREGM